MIEGKYQYFAFISYKREDEKWAKWLQHRLEHYKLPSNLNGRKDLPKEIRPVFKDTSELMPGNLPEQIRQALELSKYLIVICSSRSAKSEWVNKEVETFISTGRTSNIIPFIIEGRAFADIPEEECFPLALRQLPEEQEILGTNINEMGRDAAAIKVVARMFDIRFDELWQRHKREQRLLRRIIAVATAAFILCVLGVSAWIWHQNVQLSQANYNIQISQSKFMAEKVIDLVDEDNVFLACLLSLEVLPKDLKSPNRPYTPEAEYALRTATQHDHAIIKRHTTWFNSAVFSPDGKSIVSSSADNTIEIWDAATGAQVGQPMEGHTDVVNSAAFSPDGKYIVSASDDNTIRIWLAETGTQAVEPLQGHTDIVNSAVFSPDGKHIVSASDDNTIRIWEAKTGAQIVEPLQGHADDVNFAAFSPDGKYIVSASDDNTIRIWDAKTGAQMGEPLQGHTLWVKYAVFSPDGKYIVSASADNTIRIWDAGTGEPVKSPIGYSYIPYAVFSPNGKYILYDIDVIWNVETWEPMYGPIEYDDFLGAIEMNCSSTGACRYSFSQDGIRFVWESGDIIRISDIMRREKGLTLRGHTIYSNDVNSAASIPYASYVNTAAFSPDNKYVISASNDKTIRIWEAETGAQVGEPLQGHTDHVNSAAYSPTSKYIVSASNDKTIRIWEAKTGAQVGEPLQGHTDVVNSAAFSPDGKYIVSASNDNTIRIWDVKTRVQVGEPLQGHTDVVNNAVFSPDSRYIVSASNDNTLRIWDVKTRAQVGEPLQGHSDDVRSAAFSPDGKSIVSASADNTIRIWDAETGEQVGEPLRGHTAYVQSAAFSPDGKYIVSASLDFTVRIWDAKTGIQVNKPIQGHTTAHSASFSSDGKQIVWTEGEAIHIKDFPPLQDLIDQTRERFKGRKLTTEERKKYYLE